MKSDKKFVVVFLLRYVSEWEHHLKRFATSFVELHDCSRFEVYIIAKGFSEKQPSNLDINLPRCKILHISDDGSDITAYYKTLNMIDADYFIFFNSHTFFKCKNAVGIMIEAARKSGSHFVGTTCSGESLLYNHPVAIGKSFLSFLKLTMRVFSRLIFSLRFFGRARCFPNEHIRTNGFLISREAFASYFEVAGVPRTKKQSWLVESGYNSLTRYCLKKKFNPVVVNSDKNCFPVKKFSSAEVYRPKGRDMCLISDNRTREYFGSNRSRQASLRWDAWREK